jgi:hypothetical protein
MDKRQLEEAIASAQRARRSFRPSGVHIGAVATLARSGRLRAGEARLFLVMLLNGFVTLLRSPGPLRAIILSAAALATAVLGIVVAYAVVPQEGAAAEAHGLQLVTITGPGGTRTVAVTKTREGTTKVVPVRILRTVTGPGGVSTIAVTGPGLSDTEVITQVRNNTQTQVMHNTETEIVTETQPVTVVETDVVTEPVTVVVTETAVVTETETVAGPPAPP